MRRSRSPEFHFRKRPVALALALGGVVAFIVIAASSPSSPPEPPATAADVTLVDARADLRMVQPPQFCEVEFTIWLRNNGPNDAIATLDFTQDRVLVGTKSFTVPAETTGEFSASFDTDCHRHRFAVLLAE